MARSRMRWRSLVSTVTPSIIEPSTATTNTASTALGTVPSGCPDTKNTPVAASANTKVVSHTQSLRSRMAACRERQKRQQAGVDRGTAKYHRLPILTALLASPPPPQPSITYRLEILTRPDGQHPWLSRPRRRSSPVVAPRRASVVRPGPRSPAPFQHRRCSFVGHVGQDARSRKLSVAACVYAGCIPSGFRVDPLHERHRAVLDVPGEMSAIPVLVVPVVQHGVSMPTGGQRERLIQIGSGVGDC